MSSACLRPMGVQVTTQGYAVRVPKFLYVFIFQRYEKYCMDVCMCVQVVCGVQKRTQTHVTTVYYGEQHGNEETGAQVTQDTTPAPRTPPDYESCLYIEHSLRTHTTHST